MQEKVPGLRVFKVMLPMRVKTSSKKKQALNLNVYRNLHHRSLHAQKKKFEELAKKLLRKIPPLGVITLHYEVYVETKRRLDIMNVGSIIDKYFSDSLTACGVIVDDDYKHIPEVSFSFGGFVDKEHVLVTITEIKPREKDTPMRVLLDREDIQKALTDYVSTLNIPNANGVVLSAAEGTITAEVLFGIPEDEDEVTEPTPKKRGRGGRPRGSKNLPKTQPEETADVGTPVQDGAADSSAGDSDAPEVEAPSAPAQTGTSTKKGNLFGDKESPSSEDDGGAAEVALDTAPVKEPVAKKGSIFDG